MIAPEYFNNNIAVEGYVIVNNVPNEKGTVLTYNPTSKKVSTRTNSEIISDLSLISNLSRKNNVFTMAQILIYSIFLLDSSLHLSSIFSLFLFLVIFPGRITLPLFLNKFLRCWVLYGAIMKFFTQP